MSRKEAPLRARDIISALDAEDVDYVIIGGLAVQAHGHPRTTQDIDLVPAPGASNTRRLERALAELGAEVAGTSEKAVTTVDTSAGRIDIHRSPPGAAPFEELRSRALNLDVFGLKVRVVGKDDLIAMKRAAGRPIDRGDVIALTAGDAK